MINYTWTVTAMDAFTEVGDLQDVVFSVSWAMTGEWTDAESILFTSTVIGITVVPQPASPDGSFIPYADLTEEEVLGWALSVS